MLTRRRTLAALASAAAARAQKQPLDLSQFEPRSMLDAPRTRIERARFPVIDIHTHLCWAANSDKGVPQTGERQFLAAPQ